MIEMIDITGLREDKRPQSSTIVHALLDRLEAAEKERDDLRATLMEALDVLEDVKGNINPERGYADELEANVERAIATIAIPGTKGE